MRKSFAGFGIGIAIVGNLTLGATVLADNISPAVKSGVQSTKVQTKAQSMQCICVFPGSSQETITGTGLTNNQSCTFTSGNIKMTGKTQNCSPLP
jgi:hypothetical protein